MATCYRCGKILKPDRYQFRRKVRTGEQLRRRYDPFKVTASSTSFGMRVVCADCARRIDRDEFFRRELPQLIELALAVAFLLAMAVAAMVSRISH